MSIFPKRVKLQRTTADELNFGPSGTLVKMLTANTTFSRITGGQEGEELTLILQQDGTGSRTATFPAAVVWVGGAAPTLPTATFDAVIIKFFKVGNQYFGITLTAQVATAANTAAHLALSAQI